MARQPPVRHSWVASDRKVPRLLARPIRHFLNTETAGGIVLLVATAIALAWANSPFQDSYRTLWATEAGVRLGSYSLVMDLGHWVDDGLMALFFFVVGLEIKRELVVGELNDRRKAALPAIAAVGGMVVPALLYVALNAGGPGANGWGIPMATDIAFAVGLLALFGPRCPSGLKVFLLSLAIVDDIAAIVVIAIFYTAAMQPAWLGASIGLLVLMAVMRRVRILYVPVYAVVGVGAWFAMLQSGVHATIAGVAIGLMTPARPADPKGAADAIGEATGLIEDPGPDQVRALHLQAQEIVSVAERLEHSLHPWTSFVVIPLFALANAGVSLGADAIEGALSSPVTLGIVLGLVVGKLVGVSGFSWLAVRMRLGALPSDVGWSHLIAVAGIAGIGFTVSLFIAGLAFDNAAITEEATIGILAASLLAALVGSVLLWATRAPPAAEEETD